MAVHWTIPAWLWPLLLVLAAGAALFTVHTYRRTRPDAGPGLRKLLTGLRTASLVLLVIAVGAPVISRHITLTEPDEVLMVLEDSGSMALEADARTDSQGPTRWETALKLAAAVDSALAGSGSPVKLIPVRGNGLEPGQPFGLEDAAIPGPSRYGTDLEGLWRSAPRVRVGHPVKGMILVSDGQETVEGGTLVPGTRGPVFQGPTIVVGVGDPLGPADRAVSDLRYPRSAHRGDEVTIDLAILEMPALSEPDTVLVRLLGPGGELAAVPVVIRGDHTPASLTFVPDQEGPLVMEVQVDPRVNERILANNSVSLVINVRKDRSRVLILSGRPGWDVRFLAQAGRGEARLDLDVVYPGPDGLILADSLKAWSAPRTALGWLDYAGVVLHGWGDLVDRGDVVAGALSAAVKQGMGLLVLPSRAKGVGANLTDPKSDPRLEAILPLQAGGPRRWVAGEFFLARGGAAVGHPVLAGVAGIGNPATGAGGGGIQWLPPLQKVIVSVPREDASILLSAEGGQGVHHPLLVLGAAGKGRVAWYGGETLWELAFWERSAATTVRDPSNHPGRRLLRNLLVWLATGEENSGLALRGELPLFEAGQPMRLEAGWSDMRGEPVLDGRISLVMRPRSPGADSTAVRTFRFDETDPETGIAVVDVPPQPPGSYSVHLIGEGESPTQSRPRTLTIVNRSLESTQVRLDRRRLLQLASVQGARYVDGGDPAAVKAMLDALSSAPWEGREQFLRSRYELWSGWPFLVIVIVLLSVEWYLRRRHGLL